MTVLMCTGGLEVEVVWFVHLRKPFGKSLSKIKYMNLCGRKYHSTRQKVHLLAEDHIS